jgi:DNA-directed RNA polymerase specialized sigma24 family protein
MMRSRTGGSGAHPVEDLVQECLVRLLRFFDAHRARDLDRICFRIVDRVWKDHLRRKKVRGGHLVELDDESHVQVADPTAEEQLTRGLEIDRTRRLSTAILFYFEQDHRTCHELARALMSGRNWADVAAERGQRHDAIRQQWSRCARKVLDFLRTDDGPLGRSLSVRP